jgi:hypothetical protein
MVKVLNQSNSPRIIVLTSSDFRPILRRAGPLRSAIRQQPQDQQKIGAAYDQLLRCLPADFNYRNPHPANLGTPKGRAVVKLWQVAMTANIRTSIPDQEAVVQAIDALAPAKGTPGAPRKYSTMVRNYALKLRSQGLPVKDIIPKCRARFPRQPLPSGLKAFREWLRRKPARP